VPPPPPPPGGPYGAPPPYGQPIPQNNTAQTLGIIGIVVGLLCCSPAGIVLGIVSMNKAKQQGQSTTIGLVAIVVSAIALLIGIVVFATGALSGMSSPTP
jgi:hypothetical protein